MARVKRGVSSKAKHSKLKEATKGYRMTRRRLPRKMKEAILHAGQYAYAGRKDRKSLMRRDWIMHINEAVKLCGMKYNEFISGMKKANIQLDRKVLAELNMKDPEAFKAVVDKVKSAK